MYSLLCSAACSRTLLYSICDNPQDALKNSSQQLRNKNMIYYFIAFVVLAATSAHAAPVVRKRTTHSQHKSLTTMTASAINFDETYDPYLGLVSRRGLQPEGDTKPAKDEPMKEEQATTLPGTVDDTEMSMSGSESMSMDQEEPAFYSGIMGDIGNAFPPNVTTSTSATTTIVGITLAIFGAAATGVVMFI